ncbi:MAG: hypothetical protein ABI035_02045 [Gemmatimonadaceae bacterium]
MARTSTVLKLVALVGSIGAGIAALAVPTKPALAADTGCDGMVTPSCNHTQHCDTLLKVITCTTNYYYRESPE